MFTYCACTCVGLAHVTGVHDKGTVLVQQHWIKSNKVQIRHSLGTDKTHFWHSLEQRGKFLKKLWCCISGDYNKINIWFYQLG